MSFVTLAEFKAAVEIADTVDDVDIQRALDSATEWITHYTGRTFAPADTTASAKLFLAYDNDVLDVPDVQSTSKLEVDTNGDGTFIDTIDAQYYDLYPLIPPPGITCYNQIRLKVNTLHWFIEGLQVRVTGIWGFGAAVPAAIGQACILVANRYFSRLSVPFAVWQAPQTGELATLIDQDSDVVSLLAAYVTKGGAGHAAAQTWVLV